jgi:CBS domain-containing protein
VNLAFFLLPVANVVWLPITAAVSEAVRSMRDHSYTAVPLLDGHGRYVGTLTEGDLLFYLADHGESAETARLAAVPRRFEHRAVGIDADIRSLLRVAADQNFVPVTDSRGVLMGIVTRRAILVQCERLLAEHGLLPGSGGGGAPR